MTASARLEARVNSDLYALLKRAAEIEGRTLTDFVVSAVKIAAEHTVERSGVITLSLADQERVAAALITPPEPAPALHKAAAHHRRLIK